MAKRIKHVFSNGAQVLHLWANQSQSDARSKNIYFEGNKAYSYGYHYELGRLIQYRGHTVALINTAGYSVTTSKHIRYAKSAVSHLLRIDLDGSQLFDSIPKAIKIGLLREQDQLVSNLFNHFLGLSFWGNSKFSKYDIEPINDFNKKARTLGFPHLVLDITDDFIKLHNAHIKLRLKRQAELSSPEELAKKELRKLKAEEYKINKLERTIKAWQEGGPITQELRNLRPQLIRVYGHEVQTTLGASVPFMEAQSLLSKVLSHKAKPGDGIGQFTVSSIKDNEIQVGCHTINIEQAKQVLTKELS